ncbi:hypothetical protein [Streptomyces sp. NPDC005828]|uniref:hypothetical protein n=1 Tax=Streptomyces sp. NPDC005828 TaxID=3157071 RepID=UPI0033C8A1C8
MGVDTERGLSAARAVEVVNPIDRGTASGTDAAGSAAGGEATILPYLVAEDSRSAADEVVGNPEEAALTVVAVIGHGVDDAPALTHVSIGITMGRVTGLATNADRMNGRVNRLTPAQRPLAVLVTGMDGSPRLIGSPRTGARRSGRGAVPAALVLHVLWEPGRPLAGRVRAA